MKEYKYYLALVILLLGIFLGALGSALMKGHNATADITGFIPAVSITGDVNLTFELKSYKEFSVQTFQYKGGSFRGIPLSAIVEKSQPYWNENEILIIGDDGLSSLINDKNLTGCYITFSDTNGWEAINLYHPISSNIKRIKEIVIISGDAPLDFGVNIITTEKNLLHLTPGGLYKRLIPIIPRFEGTSTVKHEGVEFSTSIYTRRKLFPLEDLLAGIAGSRLIIMGSMGEYAYIDRSGYLELKGNKISYLPEERGKSIDTVKGLLVDPPSASVMDLYHDSLHYLETGEKVLAIFIDGFGYHQYLHAIGEGYAPFLSVLPRAVKALSVYQPVTNAGFAAMVTGKTPEESGVFSREQRQLKVPTIFGKVQELGKKAVLIQGDRQILNLEIQPIFNLDENKNGTADDEIFATAMEYLYKDYDFLLVHFKSVDAAGHNNGDLDIKTLAVIKTVDGYIRELIEGWDGRVIIVADHGMHSTEEGGNHGVFRFEDLIVPYIVSEGGRKK
jgi:hypothetical protein